MGQQIRAWSSKVPPNDRPTIRTQIKLKRNGKILAQSDVNIADVPQTIELGIQGFSIEIRVKGPGEK